jgi:hypothetical protein
MSNSNNNNNIDVLYAELYRSFKRRISSKIDMFSSEEKINRYVDENITGITSPKLRTAIVEILKSLQADYEKELKENKDTFDVLASAPWNKQEEDES